MKKLFISQPMRGRPDDEVIYERYRIAEMVRLIIGEDVEVIDSFLEDAPFCARPLWFIEKSIELLSQADYVYFADGWQAYRGCRIERQCALEYGIEIIGE